MRTDRELVEASRRGEHAAFGELVSRYQRVVGAVSYSSTGDRSISEDVAQDTFVAAWQTLDRLRDAVALRPWLCGIARNLGRKARKRARPDKRVELDGEVAGDGTPFDDAASAEVEHIVARALQRVPEASREVLVLYYQENQSVREVAQILGISEDAVMQRLARGRRYLADHLTDVVERSLSGGRRRRDLVAAVLASIAAISIPSRVDASTGKGSTMLKLSLAASAIVGVGAVAYLSRPKPHAVVATKPPPPLLHYGRADAHPQLPAPRTLLAPVARAAISADLALLPEDSEIVLGLDVAQLRTSDVWQRFVAPKLADDAGLREVNRTCGIDPVGDIVSVVVGVKGIKADGISGTLVVHGLDKTRTLNCLTTHTIDGLTFADGVATITHDQRSTGFTFVNDKTLVVVFGPDAVSKESVLHAATGGRHLDASPAFADLYAQIHSEDSLWLVVAPPRALLADTNDAFAHAYPGEHLDLSAVYGSIDVTNDVVLDMRLRLASPTQVAFVVSQMRTQLEGPAAQLAISSFVDAVDVTADGNDVRINAAATSTQLAALTALAPVTEEEHESEDDEAPGIKVDIEVTKR